MISGRSCRGSGLNVAESAVPMGPAPAMRVRFMFGRVNCLILPYWGSILLFTPPSAVGNCRLALILGDGSENSIGFSSVHCRLGLGAVCDQRQLQFGGPHDDNMGCSSRA